MLSQWFWTLASHDNHLEKTPEPLTLPPEILTSHWWSGRGSRCSYFINISSWLVLMYTGHWEPLCCKCYLSSPDRLLSTFRARGYHGRDSYCRPILSCWWHDKRNLWNMLFVSISSLSWIGMAKVSEVPLPAQMLCWRLSTGLGFPLLFILFYFILVQGQGFENWQGCSMQQKLGVTKSASRPWRSSIVLLSSRSGLFKLLASL